MPSRSSTHNVLSSMVSTFADITPEPLVYNGLTDMREGDAAGNYPFGLLQPTVHARTEPEEGAGKRSRLRCPGW